MNTFKDNDLIINDKIKSYLLSYAQWGNIMAIISFIGLGLTFFIGLFYLFQSLPVGISIFVVMIIVSMPIIYLYSSCQSIKDALVENSQESIEKGFELMKKYWQYTAIYSIFAICSTFLLICLRVI